MSSRPYDQYKESGVDWLGAVPLHWDVVPIKHIVSTPVTDGPHETPEFLNEGVPFVSAEAVSSGEVDFAKIRGCISQADHDRYCQKYKPQIGDVYMVKSGASTGTTAIVEDDREFNIWSPLAAIRCDEESYPRFVLNFLRSRNFQEGVTLNWSFGTQQNIGMNVIENLHITRPPLDEQRAIALFLDVETSKIDGLVSEQRRLIELLKEKRQAVISHAVTKGLNPNASMKPSGIQWLGDVPQHWSVVRLGRLCIDVGDGPHFSPKYVDEDAGGVLFLSARNVKVDKWDFDDVKYVSIEDCEEFDRRIVPIVGDVLYTKGGTTGIARVVDLPMRFQVWVHVAVLKIKKELVAPEFVALALNSTGSYEQSQLFTRGATNQDLGLTRMVKIRLALPPIEEQSAIIKYLDAETKRFDQLLAEAERAIELLQERRTTLISAAVKGKIDVRQIASKEVLA